MTLPYIYILHTLDASDVFEDQHHRMLVRMLEKTHEGRTHATKPLAAAESRKIKNKFLLSHVAIERSEQTSSNYGGSGTSKPQIFKIPYTNMTVMTIWNGIKPNRDFVMVYGKKWCATLHVANSPWAVRSNASNIIFDGDLDEAFSDLLPFTLSYVK